MVSTSDPTIQHTFPTQAAWRDVKLLVGQGGNTWGSFRQEEPIDFFPTYYPALVPPTEPLPPSSGPQADPCGALTADEQNAMIAAAGNAQPSQNASPSLDSIASYALKPQPAERSPPDEGAARRPRRCQGAERSRVVLPRSRRYDPENVFRVNQNVPPAEDR